MFSVIPSENCKVDLLIGPKNFIPVKTDTAEVKWTSSLVSVDKCVSIRVGFPMNPNCFKLIQ